VLRRQLRLSSGVKGLAGIIAAVSIAPLWAQDALEWKLIDCGSEKAVTFEKTRSPDARYAIGWTLRPKKLNVQPVDWNHWNPDTALSFFERYKFSLDEEDVPYELINCVIDTQEKKLLSLQSDWPNWPLKNRGYLVAVWSVEQDGRRYALVQNDARFFTVNLWLITFGRDGMHQLDLVPKLDKLVREFIRKKKPRKFRDYGIFFPLYDDADQPKSGIFKNDIAEIPFSADIPKSMDEKTSVEGFVLIRLEDIAILEVIPNRS
jgi:hypothetical protein